jgi:hypothetical protein
MFTMLGRSHSCRSSRHSFLQLGSERIDGSRPEPLAVACGHLETENI